MLKMTFARTSVRSFPFHTPSIRSPEDTNSGVWCERG